MTSKLSFGWIQSIIMVFSSMFRHIAYQEVLETKNGKTVVIYNRGAIDSIIAAAFVGCIKHYQGVTVQYADHIVDIIHDNYIFIDVNPSPLLLKTLRSNGKHITILIADDVVVNELEPDIFKVNAIDLVLQHFKIDDVMGVEYQHLSLLFTKFQNPKLEGIGYEYNNKDNPWKEQRSNSIEVGLVDQAYLWKCHTHALEAINSGTIFIPVSYTNSASMVSEYKLFLGHLRQNISRLGHVSRFYGKKGKCVALFYANITPEIWPFVYRHVHRVYPNLISYYSVGGVIILNTTTHDAICNDSIKYILKGNVIRSDVVMLDTEAPALTY